MSEMARFQRVLWIVAFFFMALCFLLAALMPHHRDVGHGLVLGTVVSCLNVLYMSYKVRKVASAAAGEGGKRIMGLGFGVRVATSILAMVLALEFPSYFHEIAVAASLVFGQLLLLVIGIILALQEDKQRG
ncbi:ATP synthase subunit I [Paenibacillus sp. P96]|uniref:ATP synthase subunit I n=1 Tax=Paenibacillus zeirhizosphaerae TaxID=2987519 RepID=A0ABT9FMZ2_9BACL|nr:ATP synthase subunit I [Paenibacillus sp. P96]MDP4096096.1 ATP synthase subunit I [Paenibacillus sp. P96]